MSVGQLRGVKNDLVRFHKNRVKNRDMKHSYHNWNYDYL